MHALPVSLFVVCVSATIWTPFKPVRYSEDLGFLYRRSTGDDSCNFCYGQHNCIAMNHFRCEYYLTTEGLVEESDNEPVPEISVAPAPVPELKAEVDALIFSTLERASEDPRYKNCIPHVSRYSDCTRENICIGCMTCNCDLEGGWNCTMTQKCRPDLPRPGSDHRTLLMVLKNIRKEISGDLNSIRAKRSDVNVVKPAAGVDRIGFDQLSDWMYGDPDNVTSNIQTSTLLTEATITAANPHNMTIALDSKIQLKTNNDEVTLKDTFNDQENETDSSKISFAEISEWLKDFQPENKIIDVTTEPPIKYTKAIQEIFANNNIETITMKTTTKVNEIIQINSSVNVATDFENLAFDDMLNNLAIDNKNYSIRKPSNHKDVFMDPNFVNYDDDITNFNNYEFSDQLLHMSDLDIDGNKRTESTTVIVANDVVKTDDKATTETVIDLLESAKIKDFLGYRTVSNDIVLTDYDNEKEYKPKFPDSNSIDELSPVYIMKRDITFDSNNTDNSTVSDIETTITTNNITQYPTEELKILIDNVLVPLKHILSHKNKEIEELSIILKELISFLNNFKGIIHDMNICCNKTEATKEAILSLYKQQIKPESQKSLRSNSTNLLERYKLKLKRDVYEIIKDIVGIRKLIGPDKLPEDMKFLMRAMKHYVHKLGFYLHKNRVDPVNNNNTRRQLEPQSLNYDADPVKDGIIKIIEAIDRNMPLSDALKPLSPDTKKLIKRIIKDYYIDEFAINGLRVNDPHYNLTNDLKNIGIRWQDMMSAIETCAVTDKLYAMKLLHVELSTDINKMHDALALINFAHSRRMIPVEENLGEEIMSGINNDLEDMREKISQVMQSDINKEPSTQNIGAMKPQKVRKKKVSFMTRIKNLLRTSKNDILGLLHKKVQNNEIFKELARNQLDEITRRKLYDYENTMQKWQDNLGIVKVRNKRKVMDYDKIRNRIKSIIPKYLRGKVHPAITTKDYKKTRTKKETNL